MYLDLAPLKKQFVSQFASLYTTVLSMQHKTMIAILTQHISCSMRSYKTGIIPKYPSVNRSNCLGWNT